MRWPPTARKITTARYHGLVSVRAALTNSYNIIGRGSAGASAWRLRTLASQAGIQTSPAATALA